jgi:hypothetical protein
VPHPSVCHAAAGEYLAIKDAPCMFARRRSSELASSLAAVAATELDAEAEGPAAALPHPMHLRTDGAGTVLDGGQAGDDDDTKVRCMMHTTYIAYAPFIPPHSHLPDERNLDGAGG